MRLNLCLSLRYLLLALLCCGSVAQANPETAPTTRPAWWARPVPLDGVPNLYCVSQHLYRSAQPSASGFQALEQMGIQQILNLREYHDDDDEARDTTLHLQEVPINTFDFGEAEILAALNVIAQSPQPVLVHCLHGADRTGTIIAAYRMVCQGWSREQAITELERGGYGYHTLFNNIPALLESLDVAKMRGQVRGVGCPAAV